MHDFTNSKPLPSLTIFFPAYNEEDNISAVVHQAIKVAQSLSDDYEILVINDGSSDNTQAVVEQLEGENPRVKLINHPHNLGYGAALISGFKAASKEWTFFSDGDGQFDLRELEKFVPFTDEYSVIIGYRHERNDPFMRLLNAKGWNVLNQLFFHLKVKDIDCAFKLFKTSVVQPVIHEVNSHGAMISAELLIRLHRADYQFKEIPVHHYPRTAGSPTGAKPSVILRAFREMAGVYRGDLGPDWAQQVSGYMVIGILNTLIDVLTYFGLSRLIPGLSDHLTWAKGLSYTIALFHSYILNYFIVHPRKQASILPSVRFFLLGTASLSINVSVMFVSYNNLGLGEAVSLLLATLATFTWNFLASKTLLEK